MLRLISIACRHELVFDFAHRADRERLAGGVSACWRESNWFLRHRLRASDLNVLAQVSRSSSRDKRSITCSLSKREWKLASIQRARKVNNLSRALAAVPDNACDKWKLATGSFIRRFQARKFGHPRDVTVKASSSIRGLPHGLRMTVRLTKKEVTHHSARGPSRSLDSRCWGCRCNFRCRSIWPASPVAYSSCRYPFSPSPGKPHPCGEYWIIANTSTAFLSHVTSLFCHESSRRQRLALSRIHGDVSCRLQRAWTG